MAKKSRQQQLVEQLHAGGVRKRVARVIAEGTDGRRKPATQVRAAVSDLARTIADAQDRLSGGPAKRKAAAKKAAATRKRNAAKRSSAAKKAARTRAKTRAN